MKTHFEKALDYVRENTDEWELRSMIMNCAIQRAPFSHLYPQDADDIADALEEYGEDNGLPEGWWLEYGDIDDIIEML